jgi:hypothetical protein
MRDQDRQTGQAGEPSGSKGQELITVPAGIVDGLRRAVFAVIGEAAEAINESAFAKDRGDHSEWFVIPTNDLVGLYELLEVIGWAESAPPVGVQVDLRANGRVLMKALHGALDFAEADASEAVRAAVEPSGTAGLGERAAEIERVGVLRNFIAVAQPRFDGAERGSA